jgi:hypothetical protein
VEVMLCHAKKNSVSALAILFTVAKVIIDGQGINVCNWIWKTRKSARLTEMYYVHEMLDKIK